ncbi:hypothetical protein Cyast_1853 [Cyanobacterium stanieri PCC 7202]|uniref:Rap1a immunity protein domain-containing protein n=1 Tax=Cyanobacterium stanieri (strain ATCC 29140 / PCC 7202) TaxID=292563 RepID=K9YNY6_CYASC|nr:hypothetical protein Cyast_1853 [Cyanobacterium stanieri PCC 7202]
MKYLTLFISALLWMTPFAQVRAETNVSAGEVGDLMGSYMCKSLITTGTMDDPDILEEFALAAAARYEEDNPEEFLSLMLGLVFVDNIGNDPLSLELMRGAFSYIINDDDCFRIFLNDAQSKGTLEEQSPD